MAQLNRGKKKDTDAPRGITRHRGGWAIRYTCGAGCKHKERTGPIKSEAVRLYHERRNRAMGEPGWCPNVERQQARKHAQAEQAREKARVSFRDYATGDYLPAAGGRLKGIATVRCRVQAMVKHFGDFKLDEISPAAVERYLNGLLSQGLTQSTVNRYRGILSAMFSRAKRFGLVVVNPVTGATKYREPEGRTLYLLPEDKAQEEAAIRDALRPDLRPLFTVSIHMGLRWSEQIALVWRDVDFFSGFIGVQRSKSGYSRTVPMNSIVRSTLMDLAGQRERPGDPLERVSSAPMSKLTSSSPLPWSAPGRL
jgi:integrase